MCVLTCFSAFGVGGRPQKIDIVLVGPRGVVVFAHLEGRHAVEAVAPRSGQIVRGVEHGVREVVLVPIPQTSAVPVVVVVVEVAVEVCKIGREFDDSRLRRIVGGGGREREQEEQRQERQR